MNFNSRGLDLIKEAEGCALKAYQDVRGIWTIGYGCTHNVASGMVITQEEALSRLQLDIESTAARVKELVPPWLNDNQFSACVSLAYNVGIGNFARSTLLKWIKAGDITKASEQFIAWDRVDGHVLPGLLRRRGAECDLFLDPAKPGAAV